MLDKKPVSWVCLPAVLLGLLSSPGWGMQPEENYKSVQDAATELAPRIAQTLHERAPDSDRPLEVAVLAFGDPDGKVGEDLFFAAKTLQGELTAELRNLGGGKFLVWDPNRLKNKVAETGADLQKLTVQDYQAAGAELTKLGLDAAVVGSYQVLQENQFQTGCNVHTDILLADGSPRQAATKVDRIEAPNSPSALSGGSWGDEKGLIPWSCNAISTRFSVNVLVDGVSLPIQVAWDEEKQRERIFLDLDRQKHYGKPFTIRLQNHGMPPAGWLEKSERLERGRFFCAAVFVDGVNSIYDQGPDGESHPSQRHPDNVTKWVLTEPGVVVLPGYDSSENLSAQRSVRGLGGSLVDIKGFQVNDKTAATFEFADAGESHAHDVGLSKDIGVISVYFYAERLAGDMEWYPPGIAAAGPGTRIGPSVPNDVFRIRIRTHKEPVEVWNIYYRYAGENGSGAKLRAEGQKIVSMEQVKADMRRRLREQDREFGDVFRGRKELERMLRAAGFDGSE